MKPSPLPAVAVNDATILIDVLEAGLLQAMLGLPIAFHVTDFVLAEILRPEQRSVLDAVALPLDDINEAAAREKSIRHGHPSMLHLWWARRPLAAARFGHTFSGAGL
jgi:hypothetical protein